MIKKPLPYRYRAPPRRLAPSRTPLFVTLLIILLPVAILLQGMWIARNPKTFRRGLLIHLLAERVSCHHCGGIGTLREAERPDVRIMCPICFGVGCHYVRRLDKQHDMLCPVCGGAGRVLDEPTGYAQTCPRCDGRGLIRLGYDGPALELGATGAIRAATAENPHP